MNGGLGFGGQSPVIQKAGAIKYLTDEPRALIERGEYMTNASIMFGANEGEGIMAFDIMLGGYIKPHNLIDDEMFWKFDAVRIILGALGKIKLKCYYRCAFSHLLKNWVSFKVFETTLGLCRMP